MSELLGEPDQPQVASNTGFEALRSTGEFRGPVEPLDGHESTDHFALVYEDQAEQFATAVPFVRQGLERGERCLYIVDDNSRDELVAALRDGGIDVDAVLDTGQLSIRSAEETYLQGGEFDVEHARALLQSAMEGALAEYEGFRVTAEETWLVGDEAAQTEFMTCEAHVNSLLEGEAAIALCQYNRAELPPEVIDDVINTHPYLIYDGKACPNEYYTPPEEYFGPDRPARENERKLETLADRTDARASLQSREWYQREMQRITSDPDRSFEEKLDALFDLGRELFDLEMAGLNHLPTWDGEFRLEKGAGLGVDSDEELWTDPGSDCFCRRTITEEEPVEMADVSGTHWAEDAIHREFGITSYLGTKISTETTPYGTLWFGGTEPRDQPFSDAERSFIELMGQWVSYEVERREHNESQRELYEITADPDLDTGEKIDRLLEVGCERLNLPVGMVTRERDQAFEIEYMHGTHPDLDEGTLTPPLTENYCRRVVETGKSISVCDAEAAGWNGDALYHEFDLESYAGTQVTVRDDAYGTVCFADTAPRREFTEAEQAFLDLIGQCAGYELERRQRKAELKNTIDRLEQSNDRLKQFAYAASHDLQEPLRMVSSYLQLLENRYRDDLDEEAREYVDFAVDGADRMRAMVDDLLAFSRVEQADGDFESVDCDSVLDQVTEDLKIQIEENDAAVESESLPSVRGDRKQLEQLFKNLVSNAIKYNESDTPRVEIAAERRGGDWEFAVSDNGIGIDPERADRIFEVFKRLHHDDEYSGTGIGLSLCQEIVENHDGDIRVETDPGDGSTFHVSLPARTGVER